MFHTCWDRVKAFHQRSATIAVAHFVTWVGLGMEALFMFPDVASSVGLAQYVPPAWAGPYTIGIAVITIAARLRGLVAARNREEEGQDHARVPLDPNS